MRFQKFLDGKDKKFLSIETILRCNEYYVKYLIPHVGHKVLKKIRHSFKCERDFALPSYCSIAKKLQCWVKFS